jgi:hypothetical protein
MPKLTENVLTEVEDYIKRSFPKVRMEFATQSFTNHVELWIYVLDLSEYDQVLNVCRRLTEEKKLEEQEPEIWLLAKTWTGPWPGGESEQEIKHRREEFRQRHGLTPVLR